MNAQKYSFKKIIRNIESPNFYCPMFFIKIPEKNSKCPKKNSGCPKKNFGLPEKNFKMPENISGFLFSGSLKFPLTEISILVFSNYFLLFLLYDL